MKIAKIILKGFQQFENFHLDLEHPQIGEPAEKVCFIGPNGTGKTTLLQLLAESLRHLGGPDDTDPNNLVNLPFLAIKIQAKSEHFWACSAPRHSDVICYRSEVGQTSEWQEFVTNPRQRTIPPHFCSQHHIPVPKILNLSSPGRLIIHAPADQPLLLNSSLPTTTLNDALSLFQQQFPTFHTVSISQAREFWKVLIYQIKKRESNYQKYLKHSENRQKTIEQVEAEFEDTHPNILPEIGKVWNRILAKSGLEFDVEGATIPIQLNENLLAYVKVKGSQKPLEYNQLSSGIRNYIFKLGHIQALYFQHQIEQSFLLVDEPENSLYPDLLYGLIDEYLSIIENTQLFVATHSPIIAAQFEPHERIHLEFDERGFVTASHGVTPIGDDPNDLLIKDFHVRSVYGKEGLLQWERFLELQRIIPTTSDPALKTCLLDEYMDIGHAYNFEPNLELDELS